MKASQSKILKKQIFEFFEELTENTYDSSMEFELNEFTVYVDYDFYCFRLSVIKVDVYADGEHLDAETSDFNSYLNEIADAINKRNAYAVDLENNILSDRNYNGQFLKLI